MSQDYVQKRIKEALTLSGGNALKARKQIIAWTFEDPRLLQALAGPHLSGIVAYNIERVASGRAVNKASQSSQSDHLPSSRSQTQVSLKSKKSKENFGMNLLKAAAGSDAAIFGFDNGMPQPKRGQASQRHINAIHQIIAQGRSKKTW